jgi:hypothetical protein
LVAPYAHAEVTTDCRRYDDVFGPDPVPVDDTIRCEVASPVADRSSGFLSSGLTVAPAAVAGFGRGDAFPNSKVWSYHRLSRSVPAVRYTFRFAVHDRAVSASEQAAAHAWLNLFVHATAAGCSCEASRSETLASSGILASPAPGPETIELVVELRKPGGGDIPAGDVQVRAGLVPFVVVASPPAQQAETVPSSGVGHAAGSVTLVSIHAEPLAA